MRLIAKSLHMVVVFQSGLEAFDSLSILVLGSQNTDGDGDFLAIFWIYHGGMDFGSGAEKSALTTSNGHHLFVPLVGYMLLEPHLANGYQLAFPPQQAPTMPHFLITFPVCSQIFAIVDGISEAVFDGAPLPWKKASIFVFFSGVLGGKSECETGLPRNQSGIKT